MGPGEIVGIAIGIAAVVGLIVIVIVAYVKQQKKKNADVEIPLLQDE